MTLSSDFKVILRFIKSTVDVFVLNIFRSRVTPNRCRHSKYSICLRLCKLTVYFISETKGIIGNTTSMSELKVDVKDVSAPDPTFITDNHTVSTAQIGSTANLHCAVQN